MSKQLIIDFDAFNNSRNRYAFLSNFYIGEPIDVFGNEWMTGEHAFQAMKTTKTMARARIAAASSPGRAKALGRHVILRDNWESIKYDVMAAVLRAKFTWDRQEGSWLDETGDALLVEGNLWDDKVWGVGGQHLGSPGRNWLGTLLMARRAELRASVKHNTGRWNEEWVMR